MNERTGAIHYWSIGVIRLFLQQHTPTYTSQDFVSRAMCSPGYGSDRTGGDTSTSFSAGCAVSSSFPGGAELDGRSMQSYLFN